jgi:PDZ domain-containing protein
MRGAVTPGRLVVAGLLLIAVVAGVLWLAPSNDYIFLPDPAHPVRPLVKVAHAKPDKDGGGIYFVDVVVKKASLLERLFPGIREGSTLVPASAVNPPGVSDKERRRLDLQAMAQSQSLAAAVALQALGHGKLVRLGGVRVSEVLSSAPAAKVLRKGDRIMAVDGSPAETVCSLRQALARHPAGRTVTIRVRRGAKTLDVRARTIRDPGTGRPLLGIGATDDVHVAKLPVQVSIDLGGVGGPSAGLAFTLDLMEELGHDVDHGLRVAATGTIEPDGCVGEIGGVKQKTIGARKAKVDAFLVPAGDNAAEARRYADGLRIVPVKSFRQALQALATLPPKA